MSIQRRLFTLLTLITFLGLTGTTSLRTLASPVSTPAFSVASGDVSQSAAVLWAHTATLGNLTFEYATTADFAGVIGKQTVKVTDPMLPVKAEITDLKANTRYYFRATDAKNTAVKGTFKTAAEPGTHTGLKFGVTGDWRQELAPYPAIKNVAEKELDFFILHGDTIYADYPSPDVPLEQAKTLAEYRAKHNENYSVRYGLNTWADVRASTSVLAMIDDHEVINDFAGGAPSGSDPRFDNTGKFLNETQLFKNGLQAFTEYMPIRAETYGDVGDPRVNGKPKLYRYRSYGSDAAVFMLDARSFRDKELETIPFDKVTDPAQIKAFLAASANPDRTLLGKPQQADLKADLLKAQAAGTTWKFILDPEPYQSFGVLNAQDRAEGYTAARNDLLDFIVKNKIDNVVFVTADFHGTVVNNLVYQTTPGGALIKTTAWEIITGPVAFDAPFGPTVIELAATARLLKPEQKTLYDFAPVAAKDSAVKVLLNVQIAFFGLDPVGLDDSGIDAKLIKGDYVAVHVYGWTEFDIDAKTQELLVTTYGIPWYTQKALDANPQKITGLTPQIASQFSVRAVNVK